MIKLNDAGRPDDDVTLEQFVAVMAGNADEETLAAVRKAAENPGSPLGAFLAHLRHNDTSALRHTLESRDPTE